VFKAFHQGGNSRIHYRGVVLIGNGRGVEVLGIERFAGGFDLVDGGLQTLIGDAVPDDEEGDKSRDEEDDGQGDPFQPPAAGRMRGGGGPAEDVRSRPGGRVRSGGGPNSLRALYRPIDWD
jgi:hypothetical protein